MRIHYLFITLISCFLFMCSEVGSRFVLPLDTNLVWYYDVRGFRSVEKFPPPPPNAPDSLRQLYSSRIIPERDTIRVYIEETMDLGNDSTLFKFSEDFVRFWGSEILRIKDGYQRFFNDPEPSYLIKFPIKLHNSWKNRFPYVFEECKIVAIDTTIAFDGHQYENCLAIEVRQSREGEKHNIEIFFNEEYGLVYYVDHDSEDEIKLLRMEKS